MHPDSDKTSTPSSSSSSASSSSAFSRLVFGPGGAATLSGFCEIMIFHPLDTIAKRLMAHQARVVVPGSLTQTLENVDLVLFKSLKKTSSPPHSTGSSAAAAGATAAGGVHATHYEPISFTRRVQHLYPGSAWAVSYKVCQRFIKFAGQPYAKDYLEHHRDRLPLLARHNASLPMSEWSVKEQTREKRKKMALEATAGCLVGVSEVVLLPLDRMKVLSQTNPESLPWNRRASSSSASSSSAASVGAASSTSSSSWLSFARSLYSGATVTAVRNAPGSFLLFGGAAFTKEYVFHLQDYRKATFAQNVVASTVGAMLGVLFTSPMDVIKTRIQSRGLSERPATAMGTVAALLKQEGPSAFYKGIVPKLAATAPRLVFSYTMTQYWTAVLRRMQ